MNRVYRNQIESALDALGEIDMDAANVLRAYSDYRAMMTEHPLDLRDGLLAYEEQIKDLGRKVHELAITFEQWGKEDDGNN